MKSLYKIQQNPTKSNKSNILKKWLPADLIVHPHLDPEPLPDERHLVSSVLRRQELLSLLLSVLQQMSKIYISARCSENISSKYK